MSSIKPRRPSASLIISMLALVLAASGTAIAATKLVSGDGLIKKASLSGNRLRKHTLTGTQINLGKLGKVPSAKKADFATSAGTASSATNATNATHATSATSATTATNAGNAATLGGQGPSSFVPAGDIVRSGLIKASVGQTVPIESFGPFTLQLQCIDNGSGNFTSQITATSTVAGSDGYGTAMPTAGTAYNIVSTGGNTFSENDDNAADFFTPTGVTFIADLTVGVDYFGADCFANSVALSS